MKESKWKITKRMYVCSCALLFEKHKHFIEHLKDTKRYRKNHYAGDYSTTPFVVHLVIRRRKKKEVTK